MLVTGLAVVTVLLSAIDSSSAQKATHLSSQRLSWQNGENYCKQRKGHLVAIHNAFQGSDLTETATSASCPSYYIGATCASGKCLWSDGSNFDFENFAPGDKKNGQVAVDVKTGRWNTNDGSVQGCFICAQDQAVADCSDWLSSGYTENGIYSVIANKQTETVNCDMTTDGGGWTVVQKRNSGAEAFWNRTWADYKNGFGSVDSNFWAGNELIHQLTPALKNVSLRIDFWNDGTPGSSDANTYWWNKYDHFQVGPESDNYRLYLDLNWQNVQGNASDGWYDITYSSGAQFSTIDKINDPQPDCVTKYQMGGWWLYNCALSSLNGAYTPIDWSTGYGLFWIVNGGDKVLHPRRTSMMIRPSKS